MSIRPAYPSIRPSLLLDFANAQVLDPRVTFTRASTATYFDAEGVLRTAAAGTARFTFDPVTEESLGLLIEESRTNLLTYSEQFDNAAWTKTRATITANAAVAPDGTSTADKLVEDTTATNTHLVFGSTAAVLANAVSTLTVYVQAAERAYLSLGLYDNTTTTNNCSVNFDLTNASTNSLTNSGTGTGAAASIAAVGNGWFRCSITGTPSASASNTQYRITLRNASTGTAGYTGDGTSGIYVWGAQLEADAFPTSYIPTVASQVTRDADAASMTGTNFSSWYNAAEGTLYTEAKALAAVVSQSFASIDDGSTNNAIYLLTSPSNSGFDRYQVNVGGTAQASLGSSGFVPTNTNKMSGAYKVNDFSRAINGGAALTDTLGTVPVVNVLRIGSLANAYFLNGTIKKLAYYPVRLPNAQLQALTR